jgi:hypothetical protein
MFKKMPQDVRELLGDEQKQGKESTETIYAN